MLPGERLGGDVLPRVGDDSNAAGRRDIDARRERQDIDDDRDVSWRELVVPADA
jgi:hypothetical protein